MIVTCASCLTKFTLDESKIPAKGAKVRCSKCQHVFFIVPPAESQEEPVEDFETFAKQHEELFEPGQREEEIPSQPEFEKQRMAPEEEEEAFLFPGQTPLKKVPQVTPDAFGEEEKVEVTPPKPRRMPRREKRGPSAIFALIIVLVVLVFGGFYLWTEFGGKIKLTNYLDNSVKKVITLWEEIWGKKQENLVVGDLNRYDERVGEFSLSVIEGKVRNQSPFSMKYIKIKVEIFDQNGYKVVEKETFCGLRIDREELKNLPLEFFKGEMLIQPQLPEERIIPAGGEVPFMVVFKDLSNRAKEFKVEISEAPHLK
jgi:predicted Zn finger-like uncharacterized protein